MINAMTDKKPNRRQRADLAMAAIREKRRAMRRKPLSGEMREAFARYAKIWQDGCDDSDFGRLMALLVPRDLDEKRAMTDYVIATIPPRLYAHSAAQLDMTIAELRRERDRALARLEAAAHTLRLTE